MTELSRVVVHAIGSRGEESFDAVTTRYPGSAVHTYPFEEKTLAHPFTALDTVRRDPGDVIVFAAPDLSLQRFQTVLKLILLLSPARVAGLADRTGRFVRVSWMSFLFRDVPAIAVELAMSFAVLVLATLQLRSLRGRFRGPGA